MYVPSLSSPFHAVVLNVEISVEDEAEVGISDICLNEHGKHDGTDATNIFSDANQSSVDFLLAAASDAPLPECLIIVWSLATVRRTFYQLCLEPLLR